MYICAVEKKLGKQLIIYIILLSTVWTLLLTVQIRMAKKVYSHQKDLFAVQLNTVFEDVLASVDTVDYSMLDSLVSLSLQNHDIMYLYDLGVYSNDKGEFLLLTENADTEALLESGFRYKLLLLTNEGAHLETILLHFPSLVKKFRREMISGYLVIILLLLLLLCCFINFFYIILKQRKINIFREKMVHFIIHELKTPLTTINLSTQLLKDDTVVTDEAAKNSYLDIIAEETHVLKSLVDEVLTVFRNENMTIADMNEVAMHNLLKEVCKVHAPQLKECEAEVVFNFSAEHDTVLGNYTHLFNAFSNLVDNAIKYRKGKLELTFTTQDLGNVIEISLADNGIGISNDNLPLIFEPFSRFNTDDAHYVKGFGLGLNYVKHIVEYHKGTVKVESQLGKGTVFIVTLPLKNK